MSVMTLQEQIKTDMISAMKNKNKDVLGLLRVISGELSTNEKRPDKEKLDELQIIRKMSNNAKEQGNDVEVQILSEYLPKMLGETQIKPIVSGIITVNSYSGMKDMGKVMGEIKKLATASQIDGKISSRLVKEILLQ